MSPNVEMHIEELVLYGFTPGNRYPLGEAVECELRRLFAGDGVPPSLAQGGVVEHLDGGSFTVAPGSRAEATGTRLAQAIYQSLGR